MLVQNFTQPSPHCRVQCPFSPLLDCSTHITLREPALLKEKFLYLTTSTMFLNNNNVYLWDFHMRELWLPYLIKCRHLATLKSSLREVINSKGIHIGLSEAWWQMDICAGWHPVSKLLHENAQPTDYPNTSISNVTLSKPPMLSYNNSTDKFGFDWSKTVVAESIYHPKAGFTDFLPCYCV